MENSSPCAQHIVALLQHKAGVMIEIVGREKKNGKAGGEKMMGFAYILPTIFLFFIFFCMDSPLCDALWVTGALLPWMFCFSEPFWSLWRFSCLRN